MYVGTKKTCSPSAPTAAAAAATLCTPSASNHHHQHHYHHHRVTGWLLFASFYPVLGGRIVYSLSACCVVFVAGHPINSAAVSGVCKGGQQRWESCYCCAGNDARRRRRFRDKSTQSIALLTCFFSGIKRHTACLPLVVSRGWQKFHNYIERVYRFWN